MKTRFCCLILLLVGILLTVDVYAQTRRAMSRREHPTAFGKNKRYYSVGGFIAGMVYFGDLAPKNLVGSTNLAYTRPGLGLTGMYRYGRRTSFRANLMWGRLRGDDIIADIEHHDHKFRYVRNMHFRNDIKELSVEFVLDLVAHRRTFATRANWTPYLFAGIAVFHHNPKAKVPEMDAVHYDLFNAQPIMNNDPRYGGVSPGDWIALKPLGTEGQYLEGTGVKPYSNWQFAIPMGVGIRYRASRYSDLSLEIGYRQTFTDYLDDVSKDFLNPDAFGTGPEANLARLMHDRSQEPYAAVSGKPRDLRFIQETIHPTRPYGQVPPEFGNHPYDPTIGFGSAGHEYIRGKEDYDIYLVIKLKYTYIIGSGINY